MRLLQTCVALSAVAALAETTPYDLIRPVWPLSWDPDVFDHFDTTVTKRKGVLDIDKTPLSFKAGELMPDTLDQAYFDAINYKISPIRVNQAGYLTNDPERQFYYVGTASEFEVVDAMGKSFSPKITGTLLSSEIQTTSDWTIIAGFDAASNDQKRYQVDFSGTSGIIQVGNIPQSVPTDKRLRIKVGEDVSSTFIVSDNVYTMAKDATLKFFGIQRSGNSSSWFHGPSHVKDGGGPVVDEGLDVRGPFNSATEGTLAGGWYDCGDHLKESQSQAFAFMALAVMSATNPSKDVDHYAYNQAEFVNTDNIPDVLREAKHGADFFLRAFRFADGVVDDMPVSVGNYGSDHGFWGRPEVQDYLPVDNSATAMDRGGPAARTVRLGELGANISGEIAAGLAILGKDYAKYDKDKNFADSCLMVAEKMYDFAKALAQGKETYDGGKKFVHNKKAAGWSSSAYNGNNEFFDDLALASVALLYATGKKEYADDMIRTRNLVQGQEYMDGAGAFAGGWFVTVDRGFLKNVKNTSLFNSYAYATYALYKLILQDKEKAISEYGLTETEWLNAVEDCVASMIYNLGDVSEGSGNVTIVLPRGGIGWKQSDVKFNSLWFNMQTDQTWIYNRYQAGNIFEVLAYADVAADIENKGLTLPNMGTSNWKADEMRQLGINQLNYMFGVNPWDISFVYGVGDKNDAHPHHRAANPEGRNTGALVYKYVSPVGALLGGVTPGTTNSWVPDAKSWEDYHKSEVCLDGSTVLLSALTMVSNGGNDYYQKKCPKCKTGDATPFVDNEVYVAAYNYTFGETDFFYVGVSNESLNKLDSVVISVYFEATEEEMESCGLIIESDICFKHDMAGFTKPCTNDKAIRDFMRSNAPHKVEGTYDKEKNTYTWEQLVLYGNLDVGNRTEMRLTVSSGIKIGGTCETLRTPAVRNIIDGWSFRPHVAGGNKSPAYAGAPIWDKDQGDIQVPPMDPYITLRNKGKKLWGYGPADTVDVPESSSSSSKVSDSGEKSSSSRASRRNQSSSSALDSGSEESSSSQKNDRAGVFNGIAAGNAQMRLYGKNLVVETASEGQKVLRIFDILGNQLLEKTFDGGVFAVNIANLPHRGTLVARLTHNGGQPVHRTFRVK